jgi:hypothetical protein
MYMAVNSKTTVLLTGALCSLKDWYFLDKPAVSFFKYSDLKMNATCSMETSVPSYQILWHHIPKDCHCDLRESKHAQETISDCDLVQGKDKPVPLFIQ